MRKINVFAPFERPFLDTTRLGMLTRSFMVTIKKRGQKLSSLLLISSLPILLTACGPAGPRDVIKGEKLLRSGDYQGAIEKLEEATHLLAKDPAPVQAQAWNFLGLAYQDAGQPAAAVKAYQQALKLDRNLVEADYNLGVLQLEQKNYSSAVDSLTTYSTFRPKDVDGLLKLGSAHLHWASHVNTAEKARKLESARKCFETAQQISPTAEGANALGVLFLQRSRSTDAQKQFKAAVQLDASYAPAVLNLAIVAHQYQHDHKLALQRYREYLALKPTPDNANEIQAVVHSLEKEFAPVAAAPVQKAPVATGLVAPVTNAVAASKPASAPKTNAPTPVAVAKPAPQPSPQAAKQTIVSAPTVPAKPLEVVQVIETAAPKAAQDAPAPAVPQPALPTVSASRAVAVQPVEANAPEKKSGFLRKLNPVGWFSKKNKTKPTPESAPEVMKETPLPEKTTVVAASASEVAPVVTAVAPKSTIVRYHYISPAIPTPGNSAAAEQFVAQGRSARAQKHLNDAALAFRNALSSDPASFDAAYLLGVTQQELSDFAGSLENFERALAIKPQSNEARYAFAWSLNKASYLQDAANELEKLLRYAPHDASAHLLAGTLYAGVLDQPKLAREHYLRVLEADPHNSQATSIRFWLAANP
jgi:tetratricopeptide (TPR) repeat protein